MALTRHEFLRLAAAASAGWLTGRPATRAGAAPVAGQDRDAGEAGAARIIEAYDAQGIHRTGTDVDDRSGAWLLDEARRTGAEAQLETFTLDRVDLRACSVRAENRTIDGLPLFDGTFTGAAGIDGHLADAGSDADIALVEIAQAAISSEGRSLAELRRGGRYRAIVAITRGAHPGLSPMNASEFTAPYGVPVVQVGSHDADWLRDLARRRARVVVTAHAVRTRDSAANVVATVRGGRPDRPPLVVMTPRSGWWYCASERGGGLACWLEAMRAVRAAAPPRTALFVASSGHELGHLGLDSFIARREELVKGAAAWVHLGANIGAAAGRLRLQASDDRIEAEAAAALARAGAPVEQRVPRGTVPAGEARNIHVGGGRYVSLLGSNPRFHSPEDRWPAAVDAPAVARCAAAVADLALTLARES